MYITHSLISKCSYEETFMSVTEPAVEPALSVFVPPPLADVKNCTNCTFHQVEKDPDDHDWFCHDDVKVRCTLSRTFGDGGFSDREPYITVACRPYNVEKECSVPDWCPRKAGVPITMVR